MEQSPSGAWFVRAEGADAPVARSVRDAAHSRYARVTYFSRRESRRSLSTRPPVWQAGQ